MHLLDWIVVGSYLAATLAVGVWLSRRASGGLVDFFISGRSLPWWLAGTSMAATTFSVDTPLYVTGLVARDQMVGPWQVPVADAAITTSGYSTYTGEAMAIGERTPIALLNATASARMAIGEALTNLASAPIPALSDIRLSATWMAPAGG